MTKDSYPWGIRKGPKGHDKEDPCPYCQKDMRTGYKRVQYWKGKLCCLHCYTDFLSRGLTET